MDSRLRGNDKLVLSSRTLEILSELASLVFLMIRDPWIPAPGLRRDRLGAQSGMTENCEFLYCCLARRAWGTWKDADGDEGMALISKLG